MRDPAIYSGWRRWRGQNPGAIWVLLEYQQGFDLVPAETHLICLVSLNRDSITRSDQPLKG
jgi:hypothetical protein